MKAWKISEDGWEFCNIVFAETASKARSLACGYDPFEDSEFINLTAGRMKVLDCFYKGRDFINWDDKDALVILHSEGWFIGDQTSACDSCGLYQFDDLENTHLYEFKRHDSFCDDNWCLDCIEEEFADKD